MWWHSNYIKYVKQLTKLTKSAVHRIKLNVWKAVDVKVKKEDNKQYLSRYVVKHIKRKLNYLREINLTELFFLFLC